MQYPISACISRSALLHNVMLLRKLSRPAAVCAMVKGDAYGHGARLAVRVLQPHVQAWGVAFIPEAEELRACRARGPIIVFCPLDDYFPRGGRKAALDAMIDLRLTAVITGREGLRWLARHAQRRHRQVDVQIKIDTGMGRSGCPPGDLAALLQTAAALPAIRVTGVFSHYASADAQDVERAENQRQCFDRMVTEVRSAKLGAPIFHMANSAAIFRFPMARYEMVRPGIALYGYGNFPDRRAEALRPVLDLYAPVVMTKQLPRGHACGYGPDFITRRRTRVGLVAAGYVDGYSRRLSNVGQVDVGGRLAPILGRVSMDTIIVDLTHLPQAGVGSQVRLISSRRKDPHSVQSIARRLNTIPHEVTCALGRRVERCLVA